MATKPKIQTLVTPKPKIGMHVNVMDISRHANFSALPSNISVPDNVILRIIWVD